MVRKIHKVFHMILFRQTALMTIQMMNECCLSSTHDQEDERADQQSDPYPDLNKSTLSKVNNRPFSHADILESIMSNFL